MIPFDLPKRKERLRQLHQELSRPDLWTDGERAVTLQQEEGRLRAEIEEIERLEKEAKDLAEIAHLVEEDDPELFEEIKRHLDQLERKLAEVEAKALLSGPHDACDAILSITPGAGGTDAQDWAEMLARMYRRWAESHGFGFEVLDYGPGEAAGLKRFTALIRGPNAYGLLKTERGVHRLVRLSPFDASHRRHTSFAAVDVIPDVGNEVTVEIREEDLEWETFRSSGPGGQHMQKNETAVRVLHKPTGIVVTCQSERSQFRNRELALKILKARLAELEERKREEELAKIRGQLPEISFGSQIRSYVLHPYKLVKDLRTGVEVSDVDSVLDGDLDPFIYPALKKRSQAG